MGRHAYHSPDMILKIRRANEAAAERRGSIIPWRHRLKSRERREFVIAEFGRPGMLSAGGGGGWGKSEGRSRSSELDIQRAVMAARNPRESKFGECLINVNTKEDPVLKLRLGRIGTEMRRMEFRMQQLKQHFMKNNPCLNHEPLILVERPASPDVKRRAKVIQYCGEDPMDLKLPGYMRPLRSQCKTPSTLTTIDAFTLRTRKKRNVWEEAMDDKEPPKFRSTVRPSAKLTPLEMAALQLGWDAHKPRLPQDGPATKEKAKSAEVRKSRLALEAPPKHKTKSEDTTSNSGGGSAAAALHQPYPPLPSSRESRPDSREADTPFVTQLPSRKEQAPTTPDGRLLRNGALDQLVRGNAAATTTTSSSPPLPSVDDEIGIVEKANQSSTTAAPSPTSTSAVKTTELELKRKRKVAIVDKPFFITQRSVNE